MSLTPMVTSARKLLDVAIEGRRDERFKDEPEEFEEVEVN